MSSTQLPVARRFPALTPDVPRPPHACANCGHVADGNFCPACGQETHDLHRSIGGIFGELLDTFAGWDSKVPMSIGLLVARPGALTVAFLGGQRVRYLRPLRLYLTMSVLFFLSMGVLHTSPRVRDGRIALGGSMIRVDEKPNAGAPTVAQNDSALQAFAGRRGGETGPGVEAWLKHRVKEGLRNVMRMPEEQRAAALQAAFISRLGNVVFVLMPIFAALLRVLYRRAPLFVAEHFVFALHVHAFAMCALTVGHVLSATLPPRWSWLVAFVLLWMPTYLLLAMRRVYAQSWGRTAVKFVALTATYGPILIAATAVTAIYAIMQLGA